MLTRMRRGRWRGRLLSVAVGYVVATLAVLYPFALQPITVHLVVAAVPLALATLLLGPWGALGGYVASLGVVATWLVGDRPVMWVIAALFLTGAALGTLGIGYLWRRRSRQGQPTARLEQPSGDSVFENSLNIIHVIDREGNAVRRNRASSELLGWPHKKALHLTEYVHFEDLGRFKADLERMFERGEVRDVTMRFLSEGRRAIPVELQAKRITGRVALLEARDRSDVEALDRKMKETEARYRVLIEKGIDTMNLGIVLLDGSGDVLWANRAVGDYFGTNVDELIGSKAVRVLEQLAYAIEDGGAFLEEVREAYRQGAPVEGRELHIREGPRRAPRVLMFQSIPIQDGTCSSPQRDGGRIEYYTDVTELMLLQRRLEERKNELQEINAKLQEFNTAISHEVASPARAAFGHLELMLRQYNGELPDMVRQDLEKARDRLSWLKRLIGDLSRFSSMRVDRVEFERVDLEKVLERVMADLSEELRTVNVVIPRPLPLVRGIATRISEVFANLLNNAAKFNDKALPEIRILWEEMPDGTYMFTIQDNGPGVESQYLDTIFSIFKRLDNKTEGTGAGLAFCRRIVKEHGGKIWAESEIGKGTSFRFTLPKVSEEVEEVERVH